ncbi:hypothetical protein [Actinocrispum sp. NPDC049592]|uniref:hypothetical protein n=1 Tax=Actinocrispum sp. NPDC049592 TaxID=3154835 RepID=UPI003413028B
MTGFEPRREMPPEVRDRLRRRLWRELDRPAGFLDRARAPLAAAAGVAVLAAGAVIVAQAVPPRQSAASDGQGSVEAPRSPSISDDVAVANAELDRCYAAARTSPQSGAYPDRPEWTPSFSAEVGGIVVTAARADGKPLFCESTLTSVTISNPSAEPAYAAGSGTGALFATSNGTVAGVLDSSWEAFDITSADTGEEMLAPPEKGDGMFVAYTSISIGPDTHLQAQQLPSDSTADRPDDDDPVYPAREMTAPPLPMVSVVDRPTPAADRTSPRGKELGDCLDSTRDPEPDRDSWQPGAAMTVKGSELIMATNSKGVSACQWQPDPVTRKAADPVDQTFQPYMDFVREPQPVDAAQMPVVTGGDGGLVLLGTVRADATKMNVSLDGTTELDTDVRAGTFISLVPDALTDDSGQLDDTTLDHLTATLYDSKGNTLYRGPLHLHS